MSSKTLVICNDPYDVSTWERHETSDILALLASRFEVFPTGGRLYHNHISHLTDITPVNEDDICEISKKEGVIFCVLWPEDAITIVAVIVAVVAVAAAFFLTPKIPSVTSASNNNRGSSNNSLSDRTNEARPNERIPRIYGRLLATPDLACVPYKTLSGGQEIEHACMCLGQGAYSIYDAYDDETAFDEISGNAMMVFRPNADVVNDTPYFSIGQEFLEPLYNVKASSSITGQTLMPNDVGTLEGAENIYFKYPDEINTDSDDIDFTDYFLDGDIITIDNSEYETGKNLNGTYTVLSVTTGQIVLSNPAAVNSNWNDLDNLSGDRTADLSPVITSTAEKWVGPFDLTMESRNRVIVNIKANSGIYFIGVNTGNQYRATVTFTIEFIQIDNSGTPTGIVDTYNGSISGSATSRDAVGTTVDFETSFTGPCRVRLRRTSGIAEFGDNQHSDTIKVTEIYAVESLSTYSFGDVTILRTKTYSTASALSIKDRKTKLLVESELPQYNGDGTFNNSVLVPTSQASDIFCAAALDPTIGNRQLAELDVLNIYATISEAIAYFGTGMATEFCYTFDDNNISYEETAASIAEAVFCKAYRRGSMIKLKFEREENNSVMLFNHRNKLPGTETRTVTFGFINDNDGIELEYTSPEDDSKLTYYVPTDQSALNPKKLSTIGIRSKVHAHFLAWRAYNKLIYQTTSCEFTATHESNLLLLTDRILNTDNTRPFYLEGEIVAVNGLELTLSHDTELDSSKSYSIFLQLSDGSVESIGVVQGSTKRKVILAEAPSLPLVTNVDNYAKTVYQIVASSDSPQNAFLVTEKEPDTTYTNVVKAVNYDARYYANDSDYINGLIDED